MPLAVLKISFVIWLLPTHPSLDIFIEQGDINGSRKAKSPRCKSFLRAFSNSSVGYLCPLRIAKEGLTQGQRLNLTALRHNHLNWKKAYKLLSVWDLTGSCWNQDWTRSCPQLIHTNVNGSIFRYIMLPFHLMVSLIPLLPKFRLCKFCYSSGTIQREKQRKIPAPKMVSFSFKWVSKSHTDKMYTTSRLTPW